MFKRFVMAALAAAALCAPAAALPKAREKYETAYFTQFNGYPWGTPIETILKDGARLRFVIKGPLKLDVESCKTNLDTRKFLKNTRWEPENAKYLPVSKDLPVINCDYYFCAYAKTGKKYPSVAYAVKDGKLIGGLFQFYSRKPNRWYSHADEISQYIQENIKGREYQSITTRGRWGRYHSEWIFVFGRDAAGAGCVCYDDRDDLSCYIHIYSPEWIRLFEQEGALRDKLKKEHEIAREMAKIKPAPQL